MLAFFALAAPKIWFFSHLIVTLQPWKQSDGLSLVIRLRFRQDTESERKVRAAQGNPLPNVEAVGDGWGNAEEKNRPQG